MGSMQITKNQDDSGAWSNPGRKSENNPDLCLSAVSQQRICSGLRDHTQTDNSRTVLLLQLSFMRQTSSSNTVVHSQQQLGERDDNLPAPYFLAAPNNLLITCNCSLHQLRTAELDFCLSTIPNGYSQWDAAIHPMNESGIFQNASYCDPVIWSEGMDIASGWGPLWRIVWILFHSAGRLLLWRAMIIVVTVLIISPEQQ